ncbi:MAG: protein kinase, partial [Chloroflexota bacterium]
MLTRTQTAKLMDFGLARSADANAPQLTEEGAIVGTVTYLAPELLMGGAASVQSDLYALGVMLYELTTGQPPFTGDTLVALITQHLHAEPASPREHNPEISPDLDALILKLLSKAPEGRPASAADVAQVLGQMTPALSGLFPARIAAPTTNLPTQLSKFIGREKEITQLKKRLAENRLITLTGSGGVGKTRLSIQLASELLSEFPHGAWLVDLAPLTDPALVPQTAAAVLDVKPQGNQPVLTALTDYLRAKKLLLVLDNCEHLIEACAQLAEALLRACPDLRLLTTSREAFGVEGEVIVRVPSLSLPSLQNATLAAIAEAEAVQLFVERASAALPGFALNEANAPIIAQVCRRLDGVALAIELAASRVKLLKVEQIAARLDDAFRFLTGGSRTALPRQQTLRATIDWSYNLLSELERRLLCRLSVFAGGWTLEAAEAVCAGEGLESYEILDLLIQLVNKSLVAVEREQGEEARYRLLETIREYALERLAASGEAETVRREHAEFFLALAQEADPHLASG